MRWLYLIGLAGIVGIADIWCEIDYGLVIWKCRDSPLMPPAILLISYNRP